MTITPEINVYMDFGNAILDAEDNEILDAEGNAILDSGFGDVSVDALTPINWHVGNSGRGIFDRIPDIGSATFLLNNSSANSAETAGLYSPDHGANQLAFGLDTVVRISITEGVTEHPELEGRINRIAPAMGIYRQRTTMITCEDFMAEAARDTVRGITVQTNKRDDEIITTLLALSSHQPTSTDLSVGDDIYTYSLHDENSQTSSLMRIFQKLMMSGFGKMYMQGYNELVYKSRSDLLSAVAAEAVLDNSMSGMTVTRDKKQRIKEIMLSTFPVQIDTSPAVLWASQREITIPAGSSITFDVSLRDPSGRATRVAASSITAAVANTDYKMSSVSGSGTDLNGDFSATYELKADIVTVTLGNSSASIGFVWFYQIRGIGIYLYEPLTQTSATGQSDGEVLNIEMVYQDDNDVGTDILNLMLYWYVLDQSDIEGVTFYANKDQDLMDAAMLPCGSLVQITETQTGVNNTFLINGIQKNFMPGKILKVTWNLVPANQVSGIWRLDVVGLSELDSTTILGA